MPEQPWTGLLRLGGTPGNPWLLRRDPSSLSILPERCGRRHRPHTSSLRVSRGFQSSSCWEKGKKTGAGLSPPRPHPVSGAPALLLVGRRCWGLARAPGSTKSGTSLGSSIVPTKFSAFITDLRVPLLARGYFSASPLPPDLLLHPERSCPRGKGAEGPGSSRRRSEQGPRGGQGAG